ncbi:tripartite ATP-independent transporter solute receptor, DctP family [Tistlia consotensis]|uniref:Tripartite ATP-independent transporter solute receptor, DctP family n=1 Tax=Tistlia consotensis USBA 355 TaxID=560819 RepID=A0A1Y6BKA6_9PROT|nr:TRAP transporter substrate-binding protein [Tistlia consotensis]SMF13867.1 tripartite ATP-independent transporter solute receptor, DctP family [Tistlia consotensis USBA 355]SNR50103.1 tripartite ATP-independent transporter solute receptor, DctP family [Tistlia consotensis]
MTRTPTHLQPRAAATAISRRTGLLLGAAALATLAATAVGGRPARASDLVLRYGHMNSPTSIHGLQAQWLAEAIAKKTGGAIEVEVYPSSQLGKLQELAEAVSTGTIALSHNTAGGIGALYEPFAALDTPYLYRDVDHLMKVMDIDSPVMKKLNEGLIAKAGVRVLYAYYFGTRNLTANAAYLKPADLAGVKIRAIPFPIYTTAVEGLGAVPVPVDWSEVPTALATGVVSGQENPVNVVLDNKLYDVQSHMMLTGHISSGEVVVMNEEVWESLTDAQRQALAEAAAEVRKRATETVLAKEADDLEQLRRHGMTIVGPEQGLDKAAFKASVKALVARNFGEKYGALYKEIEAIR